MRARQFARRERFGEVIIRTHFETDDAIHLICARRQHDDGNGLVPSGTQLAAENVAVVARRHDVEDESDRRSSFSRKEHAYAARRQQALTRGPFRFLPVTRASSSFADRHRRVRMWSMCSIARSPFILLLMTPLDVSAVCLRPRGSRVAVSRGSLDTL